MTNYSKFINLNPITKTLKFELKPIGETLENMKKNEGILEEDEKRAYYYKKIKPIFDKLHDDFIKVSLENVQIDFEDFFTFYKEFVAKRRNKKELGDEFKNIEKEFDSRIKTIRDELFKGYDKTSINWKNNYTDSKGKPILKDKSYKVLTENNVLKVLKIIYKDDKEKLEIIDRFDGFFTYFGGFNQNRENYYTNAGKTTEVLTRAIDQNMIKFMENTMLKDKIEQICLLDEEKNIFEPNYYNKCLTQEGIDKYNEIIGGKKDDKGTRISDGINQKINEYCQKNGVKIPKIKPLHKQIGSIKNKNFNIEIINNNDDLVEKINEFINISIDQNNKIENLLKDIVNREEEYEKIWISKNNLSYISNLFFASWYTIIEIGVNEKIFNLSKDKEKINIPEYISLQQLKNIVDKIELLNQEGIKEENKVYIFKKEYGEPSSSHSYWDLFKEILSNHINKLFKDEQELKNGLQLIINNFDKKTENHKNSLKEFADKNIEILKFLRLFKADDDKLSKFGEKGDLYIEIDKYIVDNSIISLYNMIRNFITKKPFSEEKMKLNFNCSTLLDGWDINKETDNLSVILRDGDLYYLAIIKKSNKNFFDRNKNPTLYSIESNTDTIEKMEYKLLPGPNKMLPKCLLPGKNRKKYGATDEILELYENGTFKKGNDFNLNDLHKLIDFYKKGLGLYEDWSVFDFDFKDTKDYQSIDQFYWDVESKGYKLSWTHINKKILYDNVDKGNIYLFQISSKDFNKTNKESKNDLQTIYWKNLFQKDSIIKLNGKAEIFFRKKSINEKKQKDLKYQNEIAIENKRYTEDKILFHCPITLNYNSRKINKFNDYVNEYIKDNQDINIIGLDRGEKHLIYYSVIDKNGKIVEQGSLNTINGVNYEEKLKAKAGDRTKARQEWDTILNIKELKQGYISQAVKKISDLILKYNAVVVMEDLNSGFKNSRKKIEQSIYQNLELALAKKLSYIVDKTKPLGEVGSVSKSIQLCPPVNLYSDIEKVKQYGVIFYTRANYTSVTDPVSGFRKNLYLKKGKLEDMKYQINNFKDIGFDSTKGEYYFVYNPSDFKDNRSVSREWKVWSGVERWRSHRNDKGVRTDTEYNPTSELKKLFENNGIDKSKNILEQIKGGKFNASFYQSLIWIIDLILQLRNKDKDGNDFILSPVEIDGVKFDSREYLEKSGSEEDSNVELPISGDANGAYNIARKGLMMIGNIRKNFDGKKKVDLYISDKEWDGFVVR